MFYEYKSQAVWSASTTKGGHPIYNIYDDDLSTFWESDGNIPHSITARFETRVELSQIAFFNTFAEEDSYTPNVLTIFAHSHSGTFEQVSTKTLERKTGWVHLPLKRPTGEPIFTDILVISIGSNFDLGNNSRVWQVSLRGPIQPKIPSPQLIFNEF
ncbi:putative Anaphase-promoting complex subunit 10 [Blattamonas nauphoetae]|uniref:Anaphase-promoting complex subunit 10 n=1 Tax=Blattamonas nauphoetae TaxID=2049346 RepID=A0ABQ9X560_9EUKA|nr:putative Anaphase-promoting complex subunit 10 [Blattamonas nauphoetae]